MELNLNSRVKVKLNEKGFQRTKRRMENYQNNSNLPAKTKKQIINSIRSEIDENGYVTDTLGGLIENYSSDCFDSTSLTIVQEESDLSKIDLNSVVTLELNDNGMSETHRYLYETSAKRNMTEEEIKKEVELWQSRIDENRHITIPLSELMGVYNHLCFKSPRIVVHENEYDKQNNSNKKLNLH